MDKKGNMKALYALGFGIIGLAVLIGIGIIILQGVGNIDATCASGLTNVAVVNYTVSINATNFTLPEAGYNGFTNLVATQFFNRTSLLEFSSGNVTVYPDGIIKAVSVNWQNASISYTFTWNHVHTWNKTTQTCLNASGGDALTGQGTAYTNVNTIAGYLGTGSGGLATWIPIIIVLIIGMIFLGYFINKRKQQS